MAGPEERLRIAVEDRGSVSGAWGEPSKGRAKGALVLAPGAGADLDAPFLAGFSRSVNDAGYATLRFNFLYRERGKRAPDPEPALRAAWLAAFDTARTRVPAAKPVFAAGKSLGGRIASMCVADGMPAAGLVFLGYPLHPPGKPERIRDEHLYRIRVPMLFIQGTRDPFAQQPLLKQVLKKLGKRGTYEPIEGGDHSFRVSGHKRDDREIGADLAGIAVPFLNGVK
jgi:predicted alpha/beta-hydrolase family hydrolase